MWLTPPALFQSWSGADQSHVSECLREITERIAGAGIYLFGEQAEVVGIGQELFESGVGFVERGSPHCKVLNRPKATYAEGALGRLAQIAVEQTVACREGVHNTLVRFFHPR